MKFRFSNLAAGLALAGASALLALPAYAEDQTVATVNGTAIKESTVDFMLANRPPFGPKGDDSALRKSIVENLVTTEILAQQAKKTGLEKSADVQAQLEMAKNSTLARAYVQDYVKKHPISDKDLKAEYEKMKAEFGDKEYKVRHILVENKDEAVEIIAKIKKGGKFADIAKEKSKDGGSKGKGGDLGWISTRQVVKPFGDAVKGLKKGQITDVPVESQFGWHVIEVEDTRPSKPPAFDQVKDGLRQRLEQQEVQSLIEGLRTKADVKITDADKPAAADKAADKK